MLRRIEPQKAQLAIGAFLDLGIELVEPDQTALDRAWQLRQNLSFYDALYVALAEQTSTPLLTTDARIAASGTARCEILVAALDD
ncbi:type II toxin-antitoxin system VapC family toxin [Glycomyces endophyticus]|uniref:type II toxin-antitoxin system VapC family toxin n=1 Tax=Glycomyces endophyticus TaxID=480996 RepID=UPI0031E069FE